MLRFSVSVSNGSCVCLYIACEIVGEIYIRQPQRRRAFISFSVRLPRNEINSFVRGMAYTAESFLKFLLCAVSSNGMHRPFMRNARDAKTLQATTRKTIQYVVKCRLRQVIGIERSDCTEYIYSSSIARTSRLRLHLLLHHLRLVSFFLCQIIRRKIHHSSISIELRESNTIHSTHCCHSIT